MEAFASVLDLEGRWRDLDPDERKRACVLLEDASVNIALECEKRGLDITKPSDLLAHKLKEVSCNMVKRALQAKAEYDDAKTIQQTAGSFSEMVTYQNPLGNLYLTKDEKRLLGLTRQRVGHTRPWEGIHA